MTAPVAVAVSCPPGLAPAAECLYCGSRQLLPRYHGVLDRLGYVPGSRDFWACRACGSLVLVPLPRPDELASFYPPVYTFGTDLGDTGRWRQLLTRLEYAIFYRPQYRGQVATVLAHVARTPPPGRKLLDLGCGRGLRLIEFRARGWEVHGADIDAAAVRYLRDALGVPAVQADAVAATQIFPPASFDLVTAFHLVEHLPDVAAALAGCFALLTPGGWLAVACPLADCLGLHWFGSQWVSLTEAPRHVAVPSVRGLVLAARRAGFVGATVVPDHWLNCAAVYALSAVPVTATTMTMARGFFGAVTARLLGGLGLLAGLAARVVEGTTGAAPACGILLARKPWSGEPS